MLLLPRFVLAYICLQTSCLHPFAPARFCFSWRNCLYFFIPFAYTHKLHTMHPLLSLNSSKWPPPSTIPIDTIFLLDIIVCMLTKRPLLTYLELFFPCFFSSILGYGYIRTHPNHFAPICAHLCQLLSNSPKHDVRGKFPGHSTQILSWGTINTLSCLDFGLSMHPEPQRTHPRPSAPIWTHVHPFVP